MYSFGSAGSNPAGVETLFCLYTSYIQVVYTACEAQGIVLLKAQTLQATQQQQAWSVCFAEGVNTFARLTAVRFIDDRSGKLRHQKHQQQASSSEAAGPAALQSFHLLLPRT